jgi:2-polyprenyl-3-methyl-5-hydroxy-6-metoxy-1,4-benzoquinol methylase
VADLIRPEFGAIAQPTNDVAGLRALLVRYRDDPALREHQGKAARTWAEREFARTAVARRIEELVARAQVAYSSAAAAGHVPAEPAETEAMPETPDAQGVNRHRDRDPEAFHAAVRHHMNVGVDAHGHHPHGGYTPAAWRHYTRRLALLDGMKRIPFESVLDVGCAEGYFMAAIAEARGAEVWGIDLSDRAVAVAAERHGFPVAAAKATALPFADGAFDLVLSTETIEHVLDPEAMVAEMRRVSRGHVMVTTPVSQNRDEHEPDYELRSTGHINDFDEPAVRRLFGRDADVRTFRCNATFALVTAFGRKLRPGARDLFYELDLRVAKRFGGPHRRFVPLRNRDWIIVTRGAATGSGPREWRCPRCHASLLETPDGLRCTADGATFPFVAPGVPDFAPDQPA